MSRFSHFFSHIGQVVRNNPGAVIGGTAAGALTMGLGAPIGAAIGHSFDTRVQQARAAAEDAQRAQDAADAANLQASHNQSLTNALYGKSIGNTAYNWNGVTTGGSNDSFLNNVNSVAGNVAQKQNEAVTNVGNDVRTSGQLDLNQAFAQTMQRNKSAFASRGLIGGSADQAATSHAVGGYATGNAGIEANAQAAQSGARQGIEQRRQAAVSAVNGVDTMQGSGDLPYQQQQSAIDAGRRTVPDMNVGALFDQGANLFTQGNQAGAYGMQGFGAYGSNQQFQSPLRSTPGSPNGRITTVR